MSMFLKLNDDPDYINAVKVLYVVPAGQDYEITLEGGKKFAMPAIQYPWLPTMCGFMISLKSGVLVNNNHIVAIGTDRGQLSLIMSDAMEFPISQGEVVGLMGDDEKQNGEIKNGEFHSTHFNNRIAFLKSCGETCEEYKKL